MMPVKTLRNALHPALLKEITTLFQMSKGELSLLDIAHDPKGRVKQAISSCLAPRNTPVNAELLGRLNGLLPASEDNSWENQSPRANMLRQYTASDRTNLGDLPSNKEPKTAAKSRTERPTVRW
jgi:hypothetical protein